MSSKKKNGQLQLSSTYQMFIALFIVIAFAVIIGYKMGQDSMISRQQPVLPQPSNTACTLDAKLCPDGSVVGRVPPSCEFSACPGY